MSEAFKRPFQRMEKVESVEEKEEAPDFLRVFRKKNQEHQKKKNIAHRTRAIANEETDKKEADKE